MATPVGETPLPRRATQVVFLVQFSEAFQHAVLFPFVPFMVASLPGVTPVNVGMYAGMVVASFSLGQLVSSYPWGWAAQRFGTKAVVTVSLVTSALATLVFGFSLSFAMAFGARFAAGLLNGIIGCVKTYLGRVTDATNQSRGMAVMAAASTLGGILGLALGGLLSSSAAPPGTFLGSFPYFVPCAVTAGIMLATFVFALVVMHEPEAVLAEQAAALAAEAAARTDASAHKHKFAFHEQRRRHRLGFEGVPTIDDDGGGGGGASPGDDDDDTDLEDVEFDASGRRMAPLEEGGDATAKPRRPPSRVGRGLAWLRTLSGADRQRPKVDGLPLVQSQAWLTPPSSATASPDLEGDDDTDSAASSAAGDTTPRRPRNRRLAPGGADGGAGGDITPSTPNGLSRSGSAVSIHLDLPVAAEAVLPHDARPRRRSSVALGRLAMPPPAAVSLRDTAGSKPAADEAAAGDAAVLAGPKGPTLGDRWFRGERAMWLTAALYGYVAFCFVILDDTYPVFCREDVDSGGLAFSSSEIGITSSLTAVLSIIYNIVLYPRLAKRMGLMVRAVHRRVTHSAGSGDAHVPRPTRAWRRPPPLADPAVVAGGQRAHVPGLPPRRRGRGGAQQRRRHVDAHPDGRPDPLHHRPQRLHQVRRPAVACGGWTQPVPTPCRPSCMRALSPLTAS